MNRRKALAAMAGMAVPLFGGAARQEMYLRDVSLGRIRGGVLACDSFNGRSALGSTDGVPHRAGAGFAWTQQSGTIAPASGALKASSAGIATCNPLPTADSFRAWFQIVGATSATANSFAFRFTDTNNYLRAQVTSSSVGFATVVAGTPANIGSTSTGVSPAAGDIIVVTVNGNSLSMSVVRAGAVVGTAGSATNSTGAGVTPLGFRFGDTTFSVTNFVVTRL